jgi:hypothetical protein
MRDSSYNSSHQSKQTFSRGGEKKVMKKSLSLLLAIALVFGMFYSVAAAATPTPAEAGQQLKDYGIIEGSNGDLMEGSTWLRQDAVVVLSRLLGVEAEAKAHADTSGFTDLKGKFYQGYISWAKEEGYIKGNNAAGTTFGFDKKLSNQEFAAIILRVFGIDDYDNAVAKGIEFGILPADAKASDPATRGDTFVGIVAALNAEVPGLGVTLGQHLKLPGFEPATAAISSAKATGAKKITVNFNSAIDTAKAKFSVLNGANPVNYKSVTPSEDKKSVEIEFALNLVEATYTVKVEDLTDTALTADVKVDAVKVEKIEFLADKAALNRGDNTKVTVGYNVLNQYGEKMNSETLSATAGKGVATAASGTLEIDADTPFVLGEKLSVSLVHLSGAFATATLDVSSAAAVSSIDIVKLWNQDNKELVAGDTSNTFVLEVDLKDQYGSSVTDLTYLNDGSDVLVSVSNPTAATLNGYASNNATWSTTTAIDGNRKVILTLASNPTAGTSVVTLISKANGAKDSFDIVVKEAVKVDTLTFNTPASAPAGATIEIPFTAVDQFGAEIANPTNAQVNSISVTNGTYGTGHGFVKDHVKNTTSFKIQLGSKGTSIVTVITGTNKHASLTINVTDGQVPSLVSGIKDLETAVLVNGGSATLNKSKVVVKDQYGNDVSSPFLSGDYRVAVTTSDAGKVNLSGTHSVVSGVYTYYVDESGSVVLNAAAKGTSSITLTLQKNDSGTWKDVSNSTYTFTEKVVEKADVKSYTASVAGTVYTQGGDYDKELTVKGTLEDGSTVTIPSGSTNYVVNEDTDGFSYAGTKFNATGAFPFASASENNGEAVAIVTVFGANGQEVIPVTVKVSRAPAAVATLELVSNGTGKKESDGIASVALADVDTVLEFETFLADVIKSVDQYGVEWKAGGTNPEPTYAYYFGNWPTGKSAVTQLASGDSFTVTALVGTKAISFKVIVR